MIRIKVSELLGVHKMTRAELSRKAKIRPNTVGLLWSEDIKRIDIDMIDKLCEVFNITDMNDLIEYIPKKK